MCLVLPVSDTDSDSDSDSICALASSDALLDDYSGDSSSSASSSELEDDDMEIDESDYHILWEDVRSRGMHTL